MVSVRRPTPRGGSPSGLAKCFAYFRYACLGGILVFIANTLLDPGHHTPSSSLLDLQTTTTSTQLQRQAGGGGGGVDQSHLLQAGMDRRKPPAFSNAQRERENKAQRRQEIVGEVSEEEEEHEKEDERMSGDQAADEHGNGDEDEGEEEVEDNDNDRDKGGKDDEKIKYVSPNGEVLEKPDGTGPTKLGFVMDFVHERGHPHFRDLPTNKIETSLHNHAQLVATALSESSRVEPCEYLSETSDDVKNSKALPTLLQHEECRNAKDGLLVYNAASFPRIWCGKTIPPQTAMKMDKVCQEPVHLWDHDFPPADGSGMPPMVIHHEADAADVGDNVEAWRYVSNCTIICRVDREMSGIARYVSGTDWKIYHSEEDPSSKRELQTEYSKYKHDEYYSTAYFKSDIPLNPIDLRKHSLRNRLPAVDFDTVLDKAVFMVSDQCGGTISRRTRYYEVIRDNYHVDSVGKCHHTKDLEPGETLDTMEGRIAIMRKYKFVLAFETSTHKDWLTEISYEAMLSGAVPIILGPPNANVHFPRSAAIYTNDYNSFDKLSDFVNSVASDKALWESFHTWRNDEAVFEAFEQRYQFTKHTPECRLCSWSYAKFYGLGWDHKLQWVREPVIPRDHLCVEDDTGLVAYPFREQWSVGGSMLSPSEGAEKSCQSTTSVKPKKLEHDDWSVMRTLSQHDSLTDITIIDLEAKDEAVILTLEFKDMNNTEGAFFGNSHTLVDTQRGMLMTSATMQDHKSKVTVLANWVTEITCHQQGILKVVIHSEHTGSLHADEMLRIRILTEDMGQLHDKMTEYFPSHFSKRMIQDFVDPLELFYLSGDEDQ